MNRTFEFALDTPWAITEEYLRFLIQIAGRKLDVDLELEAPDSVEPSAVATRRGEALEGTERATVRRGVAIIPVLGPIFPRANLFTRISTATSVELLARDFRAAMDSPEVEAILLDVDSPGGQANGISEMADLVFSAREQLPVRAFVSGSGASAAYWIASAAERVSVADTALVGSIGVRTAFVDTSERDRQQGIRRIEFVSSQSPKKAPDPTEEDGREQIQRIVDDTAAVFVKAVARNRGVSRQTVLSEFGQGAVFVGEEAVVRGLADEVGTFEGVLSELQRELRADQAPGGLAARLTEEDSMSGQSDQGQEDIEERDLTAEEVREAFPEAAEEIAAEARASERERIQAIHDLDVGAGYEELVVKGMFDPEATADSVSRAVLQARSEKRQAQLDARRGDEEGFEAPETRAGTEEEDTTDQEVQKTIAAAEKAGVIR